MAAKTKKQTTKNISRKSTPKVQRTTEAVVVPNKTGFLNNILEKVKSLPKVYYLFLLLVLLGAALYYFKGLIVAATVNGQVITRLEVLDTLEKQNGSAVLDNMITEMLIQQEADNKSLSVSQDEINTELSNIESRMTEQGQKLDDILVMQGMTKDDLIKQLRLQKLVTKLVEGQIEINDADVTEFKTANAESLTADTTDDQVKEYVKQSKQQELVQKLISDLRTNAKINYFVGYSPKI